MGFFTGPESDLTLEWEKISCKAPGLVKVYMYRTKVPGGWLVMTVTHSGGAGTSFVTDPGHEWKI